MASVESSPAPLGIETLPAGAGPSSRLAPGIQVGRYVLERPIGAGAMGEVHAARDPDLKRTVAIKLLHPSRSKALGARLKREAQALARLNHPNVVEVLDIGMHGDRVFIAMELIEGVTLRRWLDRRPRAWPDILTMIGQAGRALAGAHKAGLVHRDFKPDNVMIQDGRAVVLDFGLARAAADGSGADNSDGGTLAANVTAEGPLKGTPAYASPEQFAGGKVGPKSDQFSFCVVLYEALCGTRPFRGSNMGAIAANVIDGLLRTAPPRSELPARLRSILERGLSVDPDDRYPSMEALLRTLNAPQRRPRSRWGFVAGGIAVVGVGVAVAAGGRDEKPAPDPQTSSSEEVVRPQLQTEPTYRTGPELLAAEEIARAALEQATRDGDNAAVAQIALQLGTLAALRRDVDVARDAFERAYFEADRLGDHRIASVAAVEVSKRAAQDEALQWRSHAASHLEQREHSGITTETLILRGRLAHLGQDPDAALSHYAQALDVGEDVESRARARLGRGIALSAQQRNAEARDALTRARDDLVGVLGERHPLLAHLDTLLGGLASATAHHKRAEQHFERALAVWAGVEDQVPAVGDLRMRLGVAKLGLGRADEALVVQRAALADFEARFGLDHSALVRPLTNLAVVVRRTGDAEEAITIYERARAIAEAERGADDRLVAQIDGNLAVAYGELGDLEEARRHYERALAIFSRQKQERTEAATVLTGFGLLLLENGDAAAAIPHLRDAVRVRVEHDVGPLHLGYSRFDLAQALDAVGERAEALALGKQALADLALAPKPDAKTVRAIESFLASRQ